MIRWLRPAGLGLSLLISLALTACARTARPPAAAADARLQVVATTTLVADAVRVVGGDAIALWTLLPVGAEPHSYQLAPPDVVRVSQAELIFVNGLELEEGLLHTLAGSVAEGAFVAVSDGIETLVLADAADPAHSGLDPHTWTDPNNVVIWVQNIARALSAADPTHAELYQANATAYGAELEALDAWVATQIAQIPAEKRQLVTDHAVFGYFAHRYGFTQVGAVIPGFSTLAEPSAQELAALEDAIHQLGVRAIFIGTTVSQVLAQRVAADTGVALVPVYSDSLSTADGPAATYLEYVRFNVQAFVQGLSGD